MNSLITLAQQALAQSEQMKALAMQDQWDQLSELQKAQAIIVEKIMVSEAEDAIHSQLRDILLTIKKTNNSIMDLAEKTKKDLVQEKRSLSKALKMQKALESFK